MNARSLLAVLPLLLSLPCAAQPDNPWRVDAALALGHFQQQVKQEVGDERGQRLVNEFDLGAWASGTYRIIDHVAAGIFLRLDRGERNLARFDGFDAAGRTVVRDAIGGTYSELWLGPLVQLSWWRLTADVGYALVGLRDDEARADLPSSTGDAESAFSTHPTIAWLVALGIGAPLTEALDLTARVEYRVRYYNERGGEALTGDVDHGTQSIAPLIGVAWRF